MIHKVDNLVSIGKFRNYQSSGDVAFKKLTLIYADNGSGKTTISSILKSLSEGNSERILKRKSTNSTVPQSAKIIQRPAGSSDIHHTFGATGWRYQYPNIEIFDIHFVDENIYSGCEFHDDHKKQLHQFVIGAQSVTIQQQLDQNKIDKAASKAAQATLETQLLTLVGNGLLATMIPSYLTMRAALATNIDQKITNTQGALRNAGSNAIIQTFQSLTSQTAIRTGLNFDSIKADLETTTQTLQNQVLQALFDQHCEDLTSHGITEPENWLKAGFQYITHRKEEEAEKKCPFCTQNLPNPLQIIESYTSLFNDEFNALAERVNGYLSLLNQINIDLEIQRISNTYNLNTGKITSWSTHLPANTPIPIVNIIADEQQLRDYLSGFIAIVRSKAQNPSIAINTSALTEFETLVFLINQNIATHNLSISTYNAAIATFKSGIQTVVQAQSDLNELQRIKKRFEPAVDTICGQLQIERQALRTLETAYASLSLQQQTAAQAFFTTYKDRINHYLNTVFKTSFLIDNVVHVPPQGRATQNKINYRLTMGGHEISFDATQHNNVKDCLSEGDKSTIALAFFLSKLDIDPGKNDKILVFDDPLSSFDSNRRLYTVQLIKDLMADLKQIIVLSHNEYFLFEIYKRVAASDKKTLRINQNYLTNTAFIEPFDLDKHVENDYFKHVKGLENFLQAPDINQKETVLGWLRNVLEAHIRFKFYRQLSHITGNNQTFGTIITALANDPIIFRDSNKQQVIDKLNLINSISCSPHHGEPLPDFIALGTDPATMTVTELCHFIQDTIELIDIRL